MVTSDISRKTYHGLRCLAWVVCLCSGLGAAWAGVVEVDALRLDYGDAWQRGDGAEEAEDDSFILRQPVQTQGLTLYLPRRSVPIKLDESRFFAQLEYKWQAQYGKAARISSLEVAGMRWRLCARPSLEGPATVFHFVSVRDKRAYHMLAVDARMAELPSAEVMALLQSVSWPVPGGAVAEVAPPPVAEQVVSAAAPNQPTPVAADPIAAQSEPRWRLLRASRKVSQGEALAALAGIEATRLGKDGMLTGYGLRALENGLEWFVDGLRFDAAVPGRQGRKPFAQAWRIVWTPPVKLDFKEGVRVPVLFSTPSETTDAQGAAGAHAELRMLCGPRLAMVQAFDLLDAANPEAEARLAALAAACPGGMLTPRVASILVNAAERASAPPAGLAVDLPLAEPPELNALPPDGHVTRLLLSLRGIASAHGDAPGDALLGGATGYYIYGTD